MTVDSSSGKTAAGAGGRNVDTGRRWVNLLLGTGVVATIASFIYPAIRYVIPPPVSEASNLSVVAAKVGELKDNAAKVFRFGSILCCNLKMLHIQNQILQLVNIRSLVVM